MEVAGNVFPAARWRPLPKTAMIRIRVISTPAWHLKNILKSTITLRAAAAVYVKPKSPANPRYRPKKMSRAILEFGFCPGRNKKKNIESASGGFDVQSVQGWTFIFIPIYRFLSF
jgi:hypothetical protein